MVAQNLLQDTTQSTFFHRNINFNLFILKIEQSMMHIEQSPQKKIQ